MDQRVANRTRPRIAVGAMMRMLHFGMKDQRWVMLWKKRNGRVKILQNNMSRPLRKERMKLRNEGDFFFFLFDFVTPNRMFEVGLSSLSRGG